MTKRKPLYPRYQVGYTTTPISGFIDQDLLDQIDALPGDYVALEDLLELQKIKLLREILVKLEGRS